MKKEYLAHSARKNVGIPAQSYKDHVQRTYELAMKNAKKVARYANKDAETLVRAVGLAALTHDMGKLHEKNQAVLRGDEASRTLPIRHQDAGVAFLKQKANTVNSQMLVYSHHKGLPSIYEEVTKGEDVFRDELEVRKVVKNELNKIISLHDSIICQEVSEQPTEEISGDVGVLSRIMLSCLVDADHSDTARNYGKYLDDSNELPLNAKKRLEQLELYVKGLSGKHDERNKLRGEMYVACRDSETDTNIVACNSPVGTGKTTAIMAHLLKQAIKRNARHIFVVLPYTNIIQQSVDVYRKALSLPSENPEKVVAELHHRADFEEEDSRILSALWRAPIIVTTAVAFFETLASNKPAGLRRLHELPGSMVFVDEAHASLPVKLLPLAWHWMEILADEWQCYWILASGSLVRFWELEAEGWEKEKRSVPYIIPRTLRDKLMEYEKLRVKFNYISHTLSRTELVEFVVSSPGPRLLIMNTVQNAAVMAQDLQEHYDINDESKVMHLSTALTARDRAKKIKHIKERLGNRNDTDWTLVATSCVEAGVDISFRSGFREMSSLLSLLQTAGRINRNGQSEDSVIYSFAMQQDPLLTQNKSMDESARILRRYFEKRTNIEPCLSTDSMQQELIMNASNMSAMLEYEDHFDFPEVADKFRVIDAENILVVADDEVKEKIMYGNADWKDIQKDAVSLRIYKVRKHNLKRISGNNNYYNIYDWNLGYDKFLGVMRGILDDYNNKNDFLIF